MRELKRQVTEWLIYTTCMSGRRPIIRIYKEFLSIMLNEISQTQKDNDPMILFI